MMTTESQEVIKRRAKYKSCIKDPGTRGVLTMKRKRLVFMPSDPRSLMKFNVEFRFVIGHKFSKDNLTQDKGENYIFEFDSFTDRDACRDFVAMAIAPSSEQISTAEIDRRIKLLKVDSELNKLHRELVIGGVLTEAEFWATRKKKLWDEKIIKQQRVGFQE